MALRITARNGTFPVSCFQTAERHCSSTSLPADALSGTRRRSRWSCSAVASPEPAEPAANGSAASLDSSKTTLERVADDPVLKQRAEKREAWVLPKVSLGDQIVDVLYVFGGLLDRPFGSGQSIASAGSIVVARVRAEIQAALPQGAGPAGPPPSEAMQGIAVTSAPMTAASPQEEQKKVQVCFEILRLMQLLTVDLELMRAAVKEETLLPRLEAAKDKCKSAMSLAKLL